MYTVQPIAPNLGALPAILVTLVAGMVESRLTDAQISASLAEQYDEMQRLNEAQLTELAIYLGQTTDRPYWVWFNTLRSARDLALYRNGNAAGDGQVPTQEKSAALTTATVTWIAMGAVALAVLIALKS